MKRILIPLLVLCISAVFSATSFAQRVSKTVNDTADTPKEETANQSAAPRPMSFLFQLNEILDKAKNTDGKVEIAKVSELINDEVSKKITEADTNKDNLLSRDEMKSIFPMGFGFPGMNGFPPNGPFANMRNSKGEIELSKLPEQMPEEFRNRMTEADKDGDGLLNEEEQKAFFSAMPRGDRFGGQGPFARFKNSKGEIELSKLPEQMPEEFRNRITEADKDGDGLLNEEEQRSLSFFAPPPRDFNSDNTQNGSSSKQGRNARRNSRRDRDRKPQTPNRERSMGFRIFEAINNAQTENGDFDVQKLIEGINQSQLEILQNADANHDGFLSEKELKTLAPPRGFRPDRRSNEENTVR